MITATRKSIPVLALLLMMVTGGTALAVTSYLTEFNSLYAPLGVNNTNIGVCSVCHTSVPSLNTYGDAFEVRHVGGTTVRQALIGIEPADPDGDGFTDLTEIKALAFPGDAASFPAELLLYDNFRNGTAAGAPNWQVVSGSWSGRRGHLTANRLQNDRIVPTLPLVTDFSSGRLTARLKLTSTFVRPPNAAIIFAYADNAHYRYVQIKANRLIIGQVGAVGAETTGGVKASVAQAFPLGKFRNIRVDIATSGEVSVFIGTSPTAAASFTFADVTAGQVGFWAVKAASIFDDFNAFNNTVLP